MKTYPYVYRLDNHSTGEFYIGYRCGNKCLPEQDLGIRYYTSSKEVKQRFLEFTSTIVAVFFSADDAYEFEQKLIHECWDNPLLINKSCYYGKSHFKNTACLSEEHKDKISNAMKGKKFSAEHRQKLSNAKMGTKLSADTKQKMSLSRTGHITSNETKKKISNAMKGKKFSAEHRQKLSEAAKKRKKHDYNTSTIEKSPLLDTVIVDANLSDT